MLFLYVFRMDLRHLRYFVSVAECGTALKAAERLHVSQPALSRQIQDLQTELGLALFEKVGRNVRLTGAGEDLLAYARKVLNETDALKARARSLRSGVAGVLRVGATPQTLERLFPRLLERFRRILPAVEMRLAEGTSGALLERLVRGEIHLALATYQPEMRCSSRILARSGLLAVSGKQLKRKSSTVEVRHLEGVPLLALHQGFGSRDLFDAACRLAHVRPKVILESSAYTTLLALARTGYGLAILPATIDIHRRSGFSIQHVVQEGKRIERYFAVHWNPHRFLPPYAERFVAELETYAAKEYKTTG
jgi:LysR family cyn operon transcriptional activator